MEDNLIASLKVLAPKHKYIFIFGHTGPDFDSICSSLAIRRILLALGIKSRKIKVLMADPYNPPPEFKKVPDIGCIRSSMGWQKDLWESAFSFYGRMPMPYDDALIIFCDHSAYNRLGGVGRWFYESMNIDYETDVILIDHHEDVGEDNSLRGEPTVPEIIDETAPSTTYIIWKQLRDAAPEILDNDVVLDQLLYAGLLSDTGGFGNDVTDVRAFEMAKDLARRTDSSILKPMADMVINKKSFAHRRAEAKVIENTRIHGNIAISTVFAKDLLHLGLADGEGGGLGNVVNTIDGVDITLFIRELPTGAIRGSIRTSGDYSAIEIAEQFGGGGHFHAAGFKCEGELKTIASEALEAAKAVANTAQKA